MIDNLSTATHALASLSVDELLLPKYVNWFTHFMCLLLQVEMAPFCLKHITSKLILLGVIDYQTLRHGNSLAKNMDT